MNRRLFTLLFAALLSWNGGTVCIAAQEDSSVSAADYGITESYDRQSGMYRQSLGSGLEFLSSVPNGAVVRDAVYFDIPSNISVSLERDGVQIPFSNRTAVSGQGYYIMRLSANDYYTNDAIVGAFIFRISVPPSGGVRLSGYTYPRVSCTAEITSDGDMYRYILPNYKSFFTDVPSYGAEVESAFFVLPRNVGYSLKRNGQTIPLVNNRIYTESGNYTLTVVGNSYASGQGYEASYETVLDFTIPQMEDTSVTAEDIAQVQQELAQDVVGADAAGAVDTTATADSDVSQVNQHIQDLLLESYYESAALYSESFSSGDSFYTNTPNEGIVGGGVYFDIPYNMTVTAYKDGVPVSFSNKTYINEKGSYTLNISCVSEEEVYTARFSFRIQEGLDPAPEVSGAMSEPVEEETDAKRADTSDGYYTYIGDKAVYSSVPNGMFSNTEVYFELPEEVNADLYRNGQEVEFTGTVSEEGRYTLDLSDEDGNSAEFVFDISAFSCNYMTDFSAPEGYVVDDVQYSDCYNMYKGVEEMSALYEEGVTEIEEQVMTRPKSFHLPLDGQYDITLSGGEDQPVLYTTVLLDTTAPVLTFEGLDESNHSDNEFVEFVCSDAEAVVEVKDGDVIALTEGRGRLEGRGSFTITATDAVGNVSEYTLSLGSGDRSFIIYFGIAAIVFIAIVVFGIKLILSGASPKKEKKAKNTDTVPADDRRSSASAEKSEDGIPDDDWESTDLNISDGKDFDDDWESF